MPDIYVNTASGWREVKQVWVRTGAGWQPVKQVWIRTSSGWKLAHRYEFNLKITSTATEYNLYQAARQAGWDGVTPVAINLTINGGVLVRSTNVNVAALDTGLGDQGQNWPAGSEIKIVSAGNIIGRGGNGGKGGDATASGQFAGANGQTGGIAFRARFPVTFDNNGTIYGGGGGGGGGGGWKFFRDERTGGSDAEYVTKTYSNGGGGGGGGRGSTNAAGGAGGAASGSDYNNPGEAGGTGTSSGPGAGGNDISDEHPDGGRGGYYGQNGVNGLAPDERGYAPGGSGGIAGYAVLGDNNVTWVGGTRGTIAGRIG